jgi:hypothetical protein
MLDSSNNVIRALVRNTVMSAVPYDRCETFCGGHRQQRRRLTVNHLQSCPGTATRHHYSVSLKLVAQQSGNLSKRIL